MKLLKTMKKNAWIKERLDRRLFDRSFFMVFRPFMTFMSQD